MDYLEEANRYASKMKLASQQVTILRVLTKRTLETVLPGINIHKHGAVIRKLSAFSIPSLCEREVYEFDMQ
jgi:hypothetical protein